MEPRAVHAPFGWIYVREDFSPNCSKTKLSYDICTLPGPQFPSSPKGIRGRRRRRHMDIEMLIISRPRADTIDSE